MPTVTGQNVLEWKIKEMARRAGKKYEPEKPKSMYEGMSAEELKKHQEEIKSFLKEEN